MSENIFTPEFRAAFVGLFKATAPKENPNGAKKYSVRAVFMPGTDLTQMKQQAAVAATEKWGDKVPKTLRSPFRKNEELENPVPGIPDEATVMTFSANEDRFSPMSNLVGPNLEPIIDDSLVYGGCWMLAQVRAFAYETSGNKGVSFGLQNIQKRRDDDPIGKGKMPANKAFEAVAGAASAPATAGGLFD